jgi:hypothetical protein
MPNRIISISLFISTLSYIGMDAISLGPGKSNISIEGSKFSTTCALTRAQVHLTSMLSHPRALPLHLFQLVLLIGRVLNLVGFNGILLGFHCKLRVAFRVTMGMNQKGMALFTFLFSPFLPARENPEGIFRTEVIGLAQKVKGKNSIPSALPVCRLSYLTLTGD